MKKNTSLTLVVCLFLTLFQGCNNSDPQFLDPQIDVVNKLSKDEDLNEMIDKLSSIMSQQIAYTSMLSPSLRVKNQLDYKSSLNKASLGEKEMRIFSVTLGYKNVDLMQRDVDKLQRLAKKLLDKYPELNSSRAGTILDKSLRRATSARLASEPGDCEILYDGCIYEAAAVGAAAVLMCAVSGPASPICIAAALLVQAGMSNNCYAQFQVCKANEEDDANE